MSRTDAQREPEKPQVGSIQAYIERLVDEWPPFTPEQRSTLARLLMVGKSDG